jgi:predicted HTH domain antitoxin
LTGLENLSGFGQYFYHLTQITLWRLIMAERFLNISFQIKENILLSLKESKEDFLRNMLILSALMLYKKQKLSLGKAAELAGYTKIEFIEELQKEQGYIFDYSKEEMDEIFEDAEKLP